jgi:molybdopterin converting factor small subunit
VTVRVVAFARIRELLGTSVRELELPAGACISDAWNALTRSESALSSLAGSTRIARNGRIAEPSEVLHEGDELALLPPVGGG